MSTLKNEVMNVFIYKHSFEMNVLLNAKQILCEGDEQTIMTVGLVNDE